MQSTKVVKDIRRKPKMSDIKLERIDNHLYHETGERGKIKWEKKPESLNIRVADVKVELCLSINKPSETSIKKFVSSIKAENNVNKKLEKLLPDKGDIEHFDSFGWHISGTGQFTNSKIGLIKKEGKVIKGIVVILILPKFQSSQF